MVADKNNASEFDEDLNDIGGGYAAKYYIDMERQTSTKPGKIR